MWEDLLRRILFLVGRGRVTVADDTKAVQILQVRTNAISIQDAIPRLAEYGFQSNPPPGADAVLVCLGGRVTDACVIATGHQQYRVQGLATGEVVVSDNAGQQVYLSAAGIRIEGNGLPIKIETAGADVAINSATLTVNAATTFNGSMTHGGKNVSSTHTHGGVRAGADHTAVVD